VQALFFSGENSLPENYRVDFVPESVNETLPSGTFKIRSESDSIGMLHIHRRAFIKKGNYSKVAKEG
jgi:hypothetical protein